MSRLVKEIRFNEGVKFTFQGQELSIFLNRSRHTDNAVKLVIEADLGVKISAVERTTRQDGQ
jgi:hypothetical protein